MRVIILLGIVFVQLFLCAKTFDLQLDAEAAILINAENGNVLYEKNSDTPLYPASLTKMATALFVIENTASLEHKITVHKDALVYRGKKSHDLPHFLEKEGSSIKLKEGEILSLKSLLYGLMVASGNDAANVIAQAMGGTIPLFMEEVNSYLDTLGCDNTLFLNPHGLHHPDHKTTAYDLSLIAKKAMANPFFRKIVASERYFLPKTNKQDEKRLLQTNSIVCKDNEHYYPYAFGIKTGYTSAARYNLAVAAESNGRFLIAIVMGAKTAKSRYEDARKLFSAAFAEEKKNRLVVKKSKVFFHSLNGVKDLVPALLHEDLKISYYPSEKSELRAFAYWDDLKLPIKKGQKVGEIRLVDERKNVVQVENLYSETAIKNSFLTTIKNTLGLR